MANTLESSLAKIKNFAVEVAANNIPDSDGSACIVIKFADGTMLESFYWRFIKDGRAQFSCFDHGQIYGLPARIDAKEELIAVLNAKVCRNVRFDRETADLTLIFDEEMKLQSSSLPATRFGTSISPTEPGSILTTHKCQPSSLVL